MAIEYQGPEDVKYDDPGTADKNWNRMQQQATQQGGVQSAVQSQPAPPQAGWQEPPAWQPGPYQSMPGYARRPAHAPYTGQEAYAPYSPQDIPAYQPGQYAYQPQYNNQVQSYKAPKSKIAAGVLGLFLGCTGIHNFYLGYIGRGCAQLAITVATGGMLAFIPAIWGAVEGICILSSRPGSPWHKDSKGQELV